jgi:P-type Cu+ transporter
MKSTVLSILIAGVLIAGAVMWGGKGKTDSVENVSPASNVRMENGIQIIDITARGGYSPRLTKAKAGVPTVLNVNTQSSFDCSIALSIPSLGFRKNLPMTGTTSIEVPLEKTQGRLAGTCAMGMYNFAVEFN